VTLKIVLLAPQEPVLEWRIGQRLAGLRLRFGDDAAIELLALGKRPEGSDPRFAEVARLPTDADYVALFWEDADRKLDAPRTCRVSSIGRVLPVAGIPLDEAEYPFLNTHSFNRLGPKGHGDTDFYCFQYFPYGYTFRLVGQGPVDPFGHRIDGDFRRFAARDPRQKIILCFGGSAVWGTTVLHHQSFPFLLQQKLADVPGFENAVVLNFGIPGAVVLNAMQRFLLFALDLNPNLVVIHDGINDCFYSCTADPWLLREHAIVYQQNFELWAQALHHAGSARTSVNLGGPIGGHHDLPPIAGLKAYLRRKREFVRVAKALGARVITGLQPFSGSKASLSKLELTRIRAWAGDPSIYQREFDLVAWAYRVMSSEEPELGSDAHLNFHKLFGCFGESETLFCDMVHLDHAGEQAVAEAYAQTIAGMECVR
jgi:lysophospholipase L1-like esterase